MKISNYFQYKKIYSEINGIIAECEGLLINKPNTKHIWTIYQKVIDLSPSKFLKYQ